MKKMLYMEYETICIHNMTHICVESFYWLVSTYHNWLKRYPINLEKSWVVFVHWLLPWLPVNLHKRFSPLSTSKFESNCWSLKRKGKIISFNCRNNGFDRFFELSCLDKKKMYLDVFDCDVGEWIKKQIILS